jgi:UDP-N-acetylglucosamine 2-epimerase
MEASVPLSRNHPEGRKAMTNVVEGNFDNIVEEAKKELLEERTKAAKGSIKNKLRDIANAKRVLRNLEEELEVLVRDLRD